MYSECSFNFWLQTSGSYKTNNVQWPALAVGLVMFDKLDATTESLELTAISQEIHRHNHYGQQLNKLLLIHSKEPKWVFRFLTAHQHIKAIQCHTMVKSKTKCKWILLIDKKIW